MKTFVGGKEIKLFGENEISAIYTGIVQCYFDIGYKLAVGNFGGGSQGEIAKIDLTNDNNKTVFRVWVMKGYASDYETLSIIVKKYKNVYNNSTLWYSEGETLSERKFYSICYYPRRNRKEVYVESIEDYNLVHAKSYERAVARYERQSEWRKLDISVKTVWNVVKKQKGYKSVSIKDITLVERRINKGYYRVEVKNRGPVLLEIVA